MRSLILILVILTYISSISGFVKYTKYAYREVNETNASILHLNSMRNIKTQLECLIQCNLNSNCGMIAYDRQDLKCEVYRSLKYQYELNVIEGKELYSKNTIGYCTAEEFYNSTQMNCVRKKLLNETCNIGECSKRMDLHCLSGVCQCYQTQYIFFY